MRIKKSLVRAVLYGLSILCYVEASKADIFGGDVAVLTQILSENIQQLMQLEEILSNGRENFQLLQDINRGVNDSLSLMQTMSSSRDAGLYGNLQKASDVLQKFKAVYGDVVESPDATSQRNVDQAVAEAVSMNASLYSYAAQIDQIGEDIKSFSHNVSPGGAAKLTAESMGVMLHVMNQQLRAQGTGLKLQAEALAQSNKREKGQTAEYLKSSSAISNALLDSDPKFDQPRF